MPSQGKYAELAVASEGTSQIGALEETFNGIMSEILDVETIYRQERRRWLKEEAPRRSFRDLLTGSVPYWIVLVALVL
jgi:hypothetical protein